MLHAQAEVQSKIQDQKLEATIVQADMAEIVAAHKEQASTVRKGPQWLAALSGSVRPVVTYLIIIEFLAINWAIAASPSSNSARVGQRVESRMYVLPDIGPLAMAAFEVLTESG